MPRVNVKDKRKQQLIEANIASIAKRGLEETTIMHVSGGANMSRGIVNFYFTSKEKMMQETLHFLASEFTESWQALLASKSMAGAPPLKQLEAIISILMSDKVLSLKRLAVWSAFLGLAATHSAYAKIIHAMDQQLVATLEALWQKSGLSTKAARERSYQLIALLKGHLVLGALGGADDIRASHFAGSWNSLLCESKPVAQKKEKVVSIQTATAKPKKPAASIALPGQLDFGDLFSKN